MSWTDPFAYFNSLDLAALALLFGSWALTGFAIDNAPRGLPSVSGLMAQYRREWMVVMISRDPRIFDAHILGTLRQGTSFFASATLIAIGGSLALLGDLDRVIGLAGDLTPEQEPDVVWEVKILIILLFLANAFLKFVWSNRLFGYCAVVMAAVPNDASDARAASRARKAGEINITAARGFNRGLRSLYFALATAAWLLGSEALIAATLVTVLVLLRREFASQSRAVLMQPDDSETHTQT
ncbi:DUF599 domain-containing protein [Roseovarius sp.]|uniref:DUF599 domain-containing protein n=1 Tax=Roseovarius sp. TaxID=1486281 RepID=UPI002629CF8E|nr:DUF599 domain-containing protein [Roseovarius sp.]